MHASVISLVDLWIEWISGALGRPQRFTSPLEVLKQIRSNGEVGRHFTAKVICPALSIADPVEFTILKSNLSNFWPHFCLTIRAKK
jgi:hypothetical protein